MGPSYRSRCQEVRLGIGKTNREDLVVLDRVVGWKHRPELGVTVAFTAN